MSIASPFDSTGPSPAHVAQALRTAARRPVETASFWFAVLVPLAYPWLLYGGLGGRELFLLAATIACNAVALVLGRDYNRDGA